MKKGLLIFGAKSTAIEIKETAQLDYVFDKIFFVDKDGETTDDFIINERQLNNLNSSIYWSFIVAISNDSIRERIIKTAEKYNFIATSIISKQAYISKSAKIGSGIYIAPNVSVSSNVVINDHCIINYNSTVGHDSTINENVIINPGARISGNCKIEENVLIGANSFIYQGMKVEKNTKIDAMTHIYKDIEADMICTSRNIKVFKQRRK
ncbi:MAG: acetyltransferase [bacterium]